MKKSLQLMASLILVISLFITCTNDEGITVPNNEGINLTINFAGLKLQTSGLSGKSATGNKSQEISDWVHIFEEDLKLEFTNMTTNTVYSLPYNPANPGAIYKIILPFGNRGSLWN